MSILRFTIGLISVALISSCATNQDLANLDEVDDIYYQASPNIQNGPVTASTSSSYPALMNDASDAEKSYYQETPYAPEEESIETDYDSDEDYYDEDYARRLENFHSDEKQPQYIYDNGEIYEIVDNNSPTINYNVGLGYSNYGYNPGMNWGFGLSYGNMYNPYGGWGSPYGMGMYPYSYQPPYWSLYPYGGYYGGYGGYYGGYYGGSYGMGYSNGYYNGYYNGFYDGMYGGGYYGGGYYGSSSDRWGSQVNNEQRPSSSSSTRFNRGGIVTPPTDNGGRPGVAETPSNTQDNLKRTATGQTAATLKPTTTTGSGISGSNTGNTLTPRNSSTLSQQRTTRQSTTRQTTTKQTRTTVSPYARAQQYAPTNRSNSTRNTLSPNTRSNTRYTPQNSSFGNRNSSTTRPSYTPTRSSGSNRSTISPSKSSGSSSPSSPRPSRSRR